MDDLHTILNDYAKENIFCEETGQNVGLEFSYQYKSGTDTQIVKQINVFPVETLPDTQTIFFCLDEELTNLTQLFKLDKPLGCSDKMLQLTLHCEGNACGTVSVGKRFYNLKEDFDHAKLAEKLEATMEKVEQTLQTAGQKQRRR